ncbi:MAG: glycoside hydrolase family 28 protein [Acidobacteriota bacterium]|nr:glycoside hydrolase family 28 protein [Acidobacteriota bacterium]
MSKRAFITAVLLWAGILLANSISVAADAGRTFDVKKFGAIGDGKTFNTHAIQSAIDAANQAGGGTVDFPAGVFLSASLALKSHVELRLEAGATLLGSEWLPDYPGDRASQAFLMAEGQEDIAISGSGTIDGQGRLLVQDIIRRILAGEINDPLIPMHLNWPGGRVKMIVFRKCRNVRVIGVTMKDSANWVQDYVQCDGLVIKGIHVNSTAYRNNDGIDITDCTKVLVTDCDVNGSDDGICLKSDDPGGGCIDVEISRCRVRSSASAIKFGTASDGAFRNIHVHDISVYDTFRSAVALEIVDGGVLKNVLVENIHAINTGNAIFIRLGRRKAYRPIGQVSDVTIRNVKVEVPAGAPDAGYEFSGPPPREPHNVYPSSITGLPGHPVSNVVLENIEIIYAGGGTPARAQVRWDALDQVPEQEGKYPEFSMFGELPAWGFYVRHAEGIKFRNCRITLKQPDYRPAMVLDDVRGVHLTKVDIGPMSATPVIVLNNVNGDVLEDVQYPKDIPKVEQIRRLGKSAEARAQN